MMRYDTLPWLTAYATGNVFKYECSHIQVKFFLTNDPLLCILSLIILLT